MTLKSDVKFEKRLTCGLENDSRKLTIFHQYTCKALEYGLWWNSFIQSRRCMSLKFTEELYVKTMKNYAKFEEELTCHFKVDMSNLTNFDLSTWKSQNLHFNGLFLTKVYNVWAKNYREVMFDCTEDWCKI